MDPEFTFDNTSIKENSLGQVVETVQVSDPGETMTEPTSTVGESVDNATAGASEAVTATPVSTEEKSDEDASKAEGETESETALYTRIENTMIYAESGTSMEDISAALSGWDLLDERVRSKLEEYDMRVYLSETACSSIGEQYGGYAYGLKYKANAATLEITTITQNAYCIIGTKGDIEGTVLHEIGHLLDFGIAIVVEGVYSASSCRISDSEAWRTIFNNDREKIAAIDSQTAANSDSAKELFAEAFRLAFQHPDELIDKSPEAFNFVMAMVKEYTS